MGHQTSVSIAYPGIRKATLLALMLLCGTVFAQPSLEDAKLATDCFNGAFYTEYGTYGPSFKARYYGNSAHTSEMNFWDGVETIEDLIDAYEVHHDEGFKTQIGYLYNGIRDRHGLTWENNTWNDDLMWGSLMCIRAYSHFNDGGMLEMAKANFDISFNRAWDSVLGGGMYITMNKDSKTACVNTPGALTALFIYKATGETAYLDKAKMIMEWVRSHLFDSNNGCVGGSMNLEGRITEGARSYTQGTFVGACNELHNYFPDDGWLDAARKAMDYTMNEWADNTGRLPDEYETYDCIGFKGIFARWACRLVAERHLEDAYGTWLNHNASLAWDNRNSNGVMWGKWSQRAPDSLVGAWEASTGLSIVNNIYRYGAATTAVYPKQVFADAGAHLFSVRQIPGSRSIVLENVKEMGGCTVSIIDLGGRVVKHATLQNKADAIAVDDLAGGLFTVLIESAGYRGVERLVVD